MSTEGFPGGASGKERTGQCRRCKGRGFNPWVRKIPLEEGLAIPTPVFLPGDSPGTEEPWRATVHRSAKSQTRLKQLSIHSRTGLIMHWNG